MKPTKRKAFNFLRSYFDVLNELKDDNDKLNFLLSIINKQFLDKDPKDLNFIVNLCYESQRHSIESSVKGWKRASKTDLIGTPLTTPPTPKGLDPQTPKQEEEEQVQEQEEEEVKIYIEKENYNFSSELLNDAQWVENICRINKLGIDGKIKVKKYLDTFNSKLITELETKTNKKDFASHFSRWLAIELRKDNTNSKKEKITGAEAFKNLVYGSATNL